MAFTHLFCAADDERDRLAFPKHVPAHRMQNKVQAQPLRPPTASGPKGTKTA